MRINFPIKVRRVIAERSAYRCSFPECYRLTIGPGASDAEVSCTGVASHIYSASPGGPRGSAGLSPLEVKAPANAIWLCGEHARQVDNNRGIKFPAPLLLSYKSLHEARISREQHNVYLPFTWLQQLIVSRAPVFATPATLTLGKVTVIIGGNASGKTALYEWLAGISNPAILERWRPPVGAASGLLFNVTYFTPQRHMIGVEISGSESIRYRVDDQEVPYNPYPIKFIVVRPQRAAKFRDKLSDLQRIAVMLGTDVAAVEELLPRVGHGLVNNVNRLWLSKKGHKLRLLTDVRGTCPGLDFNHLSSGEQACVLVELGIALARFSAQYVPTVLVIDSQDLNLPPHILKDYVDVLLAPENLFQSVLEVLADGDQLSWRGCELVMLKGKVSDVRIEQ
jgi:hypothetical protein